MPATRPTRLLVVALAVGLTAAGAAVGARWVVDEVRPSACVFAAADQEVRLTPEQAANAATIAGISVDRGLSPRAATIALATAIQESKLRNLRYGDADSQGLFQQRPSQGWGTVEQVTDPVYASHAFYDVLVQVEGWDSGVVTEVAQEVQRSAFPDAYADHEWEGRVLASILTGQEGSGTDLTCRLPDVGSPGSVAELAAKAETQLGVTGSASGRSLTVETTGSARAWSAATWAVSHAEAEQVVRVLVDGQEWTRDRGHFAPHDDDDGAATSSPTAVVIEVA